MSIDNEYEDYPGAELAFLASRALFGNGRVMPLALDVLECEETEFYPTHIGWRGSEAAGALARLQRLGLIERIEGVKPAAYVKVGQGGTMWEIVEHFRACVSRAEAGYKAADLPRLKPALGSDMRWLDRCDKVGCRHLCDGTMRLNFLLVMYGRGRRPFWLVDVPASSKYYQGQLAAAGMLQSGLRNEQHWRSWIKLPSPLWELVPTMWQYLVETYPEPRPTVAFWLPSIFDIEPKVLPYDITPSPF